MASLGCSRLICSISLRFFSPPEKPTLTLRLSHVGGHAEAGGFGAGELEEGGGVQFGLAAGAADGVERGAQEVRVAHAGEFDGGLEGEEQAGLRAQFGGEVQQVRAVEGDAAFGDGEIVTAGEHVGERGFTRAVWAHDGVDLSVADGEVYAAQDRFFRRCWRGGW